MPTPKAGYRDAGGNRLPGVTTILGAHKDAGGLVHAAWKLGSQGLNYRNEWDKAAKIGTCLHARIEAFITKTDFDEMEHTGGAVTHSQLAYESFLRWAEGRTFTGDCEVPLIHPRGFGGTIDYLEPGLILDWKSNKALYPEVYAQVGGYALLIEVHFGQLPDCKVIRFDKEGRDAEVLDLPAQSPKAIAGRKLFLGLLDAYEAKREIERK